jgi:signal transduction histidine kinase
MDEDEIVRVMAPFGQSSGSFARTSEGPGLGLTLVHSLIRLHGGAFELVSQKGIGTTASVIIPAARTRVT